MKRLLRKPMPQISPAAPVTLLVVPANVANSFGPLSSFAFGWLVPRMGLMDRCADQSSHRLVSPPHSADKLRPKILLSGSVDISIGTATSMPLGRSVKV